RFLLKFSLGYPSPTEEKAILRRFQRANPLDDLPAVIEAADLLAMQRTCRDVFVGEPVEDYVVELVRASRAHPAIELGASPRGTLGLYQAAQALAAIGGRSYVIPDDVKRLAPAVLSHRLIASAQARLRGHSIAEIVAEVLASVPVPVEDDLPVAPGTLAQSRMADQSADRAGG
ncbi:MAG TPA: MoxR family ATPase, partial [Dehalococcoidia bacterium]|nr:MoxR family ATPase [Dehalococcoidia bacterium]